MKRFAKGEPAIGTGSARIPLARLRAFEGIVPRATDWRSLGVDDETPGAERVPGRPVAAVQSQPAD